MVKQYTDRPYVICHMTTSIDGKVTGRFLYETACESGIEAYYQINRDWMADAFACGRITMEGSFTSGWKPDLTAFEGIEVPEGDYIADKDANLYAVAFDRRGRLGWKTARIEDEDPGYGDSHIIEVLCESVSQKYLAYLRSIGVSYIFAGAEEMDILLALRKLKELFGIEKLLLEGGSVLDGAFLQADVVDALSLVMLPVIADADGKSLFSQSDMTLFELEQAKTMDNGVVWLTYNRK